MTEHPQLDEQRLPAAVERVRGLLSLRVRFFDPLNVQIGGYLAGLSVGDQGGQAAWGVWRLVDPLAPPKTTRDGQYEGAEVELPEIAGGYSAPELAVLRAWLCHLDEQLAAAAGEEAPAAVEVVAPAKRPATPAERAEHYQSLRRAAGVVLRELRWLEARGVPLADAAGQEAVRDAIGSVKYLMLCIRDLKQP